jgi:hypothetical protein
MPKLTCIAIAVLLGIAAIANGTFMLVGPERWYLEVPGVTTTGPFNQHFVRDIGLIFLFLGGAFLLGAVRPDLRIALWAAPSIWLAGHALFHFWEVAVGICGPSALARDFSAVTLPAVLGLAITGWAMTDTRGASSASAARTA